MTSSFSVRYKYKRSHCSHMEDIEAVRNQEFNFNFKNCEFFTLESITDNERDCLYIIAAIDYIDRIARRKLSESWGREFSLEIPVSDPPFWNKKDVLFSIQDVLRFLTGDIWNIYFIKRTKTTGRDNMLPLSSTDNDEEYIVLPYSDGLDSYALGRILSENNQNIKQIRVTSWNSAYKNENKFLCKDGNRRIAIPISTRVGNHAEESYRTRPFKIFFYGRARGEESKIKYHLYCRKRTGNFWSITCHKRLRKCICWHTPTLHSQTEVVY